MLYIRGTGSSIGSMAQVLVQVLVHADLPLGIQVPVNNHNDADLTHVEIGF